MTAIDQGNMLNPQYAQIGFPHLHFACVSSTNMVAKTLAQQGAPHGTTITAAQQTKGRGRQGREWFSAVNTSLLCSLILREQPSILPIRIGVACATAIDSFTVSRKVSIKWPNDILLDSRKVAGILIEGQPQANWSIVGIGVNVTTKEEQFPRELRSHVTSLGLNQNDIAVVYQKCISAIRYWLTQPTKQVQTYWNEHDALRGQELRRGLLQGKGEGIEADGSLAVACTDGKRRYVRWGEI